MPTTVIDPIIHWLHHHPHWAGFATFLISFSETLVVVGSLIPGSVMMTAIGGLIGLGVIPMGSTVLLAILGAILGDGFSYWLGYHYHEHIREMWPFRAIPKWMAAGEQFFALHGGKSIFLGRFVGPVRAFMPVIAGMMQLDPRRYILANISSAILWAPAYLLPGYLLGTATKSLPPETAIKCVLLVLALLLLLWCSAWLIRQVCQNGYRLADKGVARLHQFIFATHQLRTLQTVLYDAQAPGAHRQLASLMRLLLLIPLLLLLAYHVRTTGSLTLYNAPLWALLRSIHQPHLTEFFVLVSFLGDKLILLPFMAALALILLRQNHTALSLHGLLLIVLSVAAIVSLKHGIAFPRPSGLVHSPAGFSFPSGHATLSTAIYGLLAILLHEVYPKWRGAILRGTITLVLVVGLSRLYLGAHWLTDVIAGFILGGILLNLTLLSLRRYAYTKPTPSDHFFLLALLCFVLLWLPIAAHYFKKTNAHYQLKRPSYQLSVQQWWVNDGTPVPYYRHTRTGVAAELLNLQWLGQLDSIKAQLTALGWQPGPVRTLSDTLIKLTHFGRQYRLPLFDQLYLDHRPSLILLKSYQSKHHTPFWLVLRLWPSGITVVGSPKPLWVGTVGFSDSKHPDYVSLKIHEDHNGVAIQTSATQLLANDLKDFNWKRVHIVNRWHLAASEFGHQFALLIQPR